MTHVDDTIISGSDTEGRQRLVQTLRERFKLKDMGEVKLILGMEVHRDSDGIKLTQQKYVETMLAKFNMDRCKPTPTPIPVGVQLSVRDSPSTDAERRTMAAIPYKQLVGHLNYLANNTRPDISGVVSDLGRHMANPGMAHWKLAKRLLRYIAGTKDLGITFSGSKGEDTIRLVLTAYIDADFAEDRDTRRSHTGLAVFLGPALITWKGRKRQTCVSTSSTQSEYVALYLAVQEVTYLRQLLKELQLAQEEPTTIYEDNQGAIALANNPIHHARTKHIDVKYHFIREQVQLGSVKLQYVPTADQVADLLTKPLGKPKFIRFRTILLGGGP
jgi:hypothetical protein